MLTDADHVWHAMYFKHPNERARYIKSQVPHADADHLLRKYNKFPKIYRDDLVEFAVIVNGKVIDTVQKRQDAHDLAKKQEGYVVVADVPKSESRNPKYDRYYQEIIKTPLVPPKEEASENEQVEEEKTSAEPAETEQQTSATSVETEQEQTPTTEQVQVAVEETEQQPSATSATAVETEQEQTSTTEQVQVIEKETEQPPAAVETEQEQTSTTEQVETEEPLATAVETEQEQTSTTEQVQVVE